MTRILVVDDNPDMLSLLKSALEHAAYSVSVARDGLSALAVQSANPADIIITDLFMPGGNGFEEIAALRQHFPSAKIIAMSGGLPLIKADPAAAAKAIGADAALLKPFELPALLTLVQSMID